VVPMFQTPPIKSRQGFHGTGGLNFSSQCTSKYNLGSIALLYLVPHHTKS
jgi:hypothetical protein